MDEQNLILRLQAGGRRALEEIIQGCTRYLTAAYRGVTLTMTAGESRYQMNGETVELLFETRYDKTDPEYEAFPEYIALEDGVLTAPVNLLDHWSLNYIPLRGADGELAGQMLVIP